MYGPDEQRFSSKDLPFDPVIYDGSNAEDVHFFNNAPNSVEGERWEKFPSPGLYIDSDALSQPSSRFRHGFASVTPEVSGRSPTLPLYFPEHGSLSQSTFRGGQHNRPLTWTPYLTGATPWSFAYDGSSKFWKSQFAWLSLYFIFNLLLTLSNKSVLTEFPFPYTLTALHALSSTLGGSWLRWRGVYTPKRLRNSEELVLAGFSVLYAINIAVSNISLNLVTVPFHQVVRAITPIFTMALSRFFYNARSKRRQLLSLVPVIFGVVLATYGDYYFTAWGFFLTLFGTFLAALKTIYTNVLQSTPKPLSASAHTTSTWNPALARKRSFGKPKCAQGSFYGELVRYMLPPQLDLHPLDLLTRMSPLAFVQCVIYAYLSGELERVRQFSVGRISYSVSYNSTMIATHETHEPHVRGIDLLKILVLLVNACIAFGLNVVSFSTNGKVGALSITVAANVKQVLTILFAVSLFDLTITSTNAVGIMITLIGGAWYACEEYSTKTREAYKMAS